MDIRCPEVMQALFKAFGVEANSPRVSVFPKTYYPDRLGFYVPGFRYIAILESLEEDQFMDIVAHELGHYMQYQGEWRETGFPPGLCKRQVLRAIRDFRYSYSKLYPEKEWLLEPFAFWLSKNWRNVLLGKIPIYGKSPDAYRSRGPKNTRRARRRRTSCSS